MLQLFHENENQIMSNDFPELSIKRKEAIIEFEKNGFPTTKLESWKNTELKKVLSVDYACHFKPPFTESNELEKVFQCNIPHLNTEMISQLNGWHIDHGKPLVVTSEGVIYGSLMAALTRYPEIVEKYLATLAPLNKDGFHALNTAFAMDGVFLYVPPFVELKKPIQFVNIIRSETSIFVQNRNLIILGEQSKATIVQCDDSVDHQAGLINTMTEVFLGENVSLDHYKLQNKNNNSTLINNIYFKQENGSNLKSVSLILNGGIIRNYNHVTLNGPRSNAELYGLYLMDKNQHTDNQLFIEHNAPDCSSNQLYKGILDDSASASFQGHILVKKNSQRTTAYQSNKNILLTDKASVDTKPFLEIYADDVKCSHGATVGQLDHEAMFYLRSRGISEDNARMLLMYAFSAGIIDKITIEPLRIRIDDMVKKRLRGELSICDQCVLHCSTAEKPVEFQIDLSKI